MPSGTRELANRADFPLVSELTGEEIVPMLLPNGSAAAFETNLIFSLVSDLEGQFGETIENLGDDIDALGVRITDVENLAATGVSWTSNAVEGRSTANVNLATGLVNGQTLNGLTVQTGKFYFLGSQTSATENGIYIGVAAGAASRADWANSAAELARIGFVLSGGTVGAGERWTLPLVAGSINLGVTALNFARIGIEVGVAPEIFEARDGLTDLNERLLRDAAAVGPQIDLALEGTETEFFDIARQPAWVLMTSDGRHGISVYHDLSVYFKPSARLIEEITGSAGANYADNIDEDDVLASKVVSSDLVRLWADPEGMTLRRFVVRTDFDSLRTALMAGASVRALMFYGQSNNEGNSNGVVVNGSPTFPAQVLRLAGVAGTLGTGNIDSNAAGITDFLPANEAISGVLGESPATATCNAMVRSAEASDVDLYVTRNSSKGGFTANKLKPGTIPYNNMIAELTRIGQLLEISDPRRIMVRFFDLQGETDATGAIDELGIGPNLGTPAATFEALKLDAYNGALAAAATLGMTDAFWVINQAGTNTSFSYCYANLPAAVLEKITREDTTGKLLRGEPNYQFPVYDNYHTTAPAKAKLGELNARTVRLIEAGKQHCIDIESVTISGANILVDVVLPEGVELEIQNLAGLVQYGFRLWSTPFVSTAADAGANIPISGIALAEIDGVKRRIVITPSSAPTAGQELRYAFKDNNSVGGGYYGARGGVMTTYNEVAVVDGSPLRFHLPVFLRTL